MALPENRIKKIKLPNNTEYEIIPEKISDGNGNYATLPNLTSDDIIVTEECEMSYSTAWSILTNSVKMPSNTTVSNNSINFPAGVTVTNHNINL